MPRAHGPQSKLKAAPRVIEPELLTREQQIYQDRLSGLSILTIADRYRTDVVEVEAIVARMCPSVTTQMKLATAELEIARLDELQAAFHAKAKAGDVQCAAIVLRISERRSQLLGLDSPLKVDAVQVRAEAVREAPSSVDRIRQALDRLRVPADANGAPAGESEPQH